MMKGNFKCHSKLDRKRTSFTEKFASYYGNIRGLLLGSNLIGRRSACNENLFSEEAQLTAFKKEKEEGQLRPRSVDLQRNVNRYGHRTNQYELPNLILRRGQPFEIHIVFDRNFVPSEDTIVLKFVTGSRPLQSKGTVVSVNRVQELKSNQWGYEITSVEEKKVAMRVSSASDCIVGRYQFYVDTCRGNQQNAVDSYRFKNPDDIYILFNPWSPADNVYLEDEDERQHHCLSETGRIWLGTVGKFCVRPWNFAQFDDVCLMAALALMDKSELGDQARGCPIRVVRALCRAINNNERDGGVLVGNWSGKYDDGMAPYAWNGSAAILEEFLKKRKGVKFGQCWTFSAVATTIFRTLGIPTRCVTNFKSAHDSDYSGPVDAYWSPEGKPRKLYDDAIWDFHVWNESWFKRPDLPPGYDGWQAYDATPQEVSEGVFTCGPAPVKGIREGDLHLGYDTKFLFSEIHGDRVHWVLDSMGNMTPFAVEKNAVGRSISTKAVNTISRDDLTQHYKYPDGSPELAACMEKAKKHALRSLPEIPAPSKSDIDFTFTGEGYRTGDVSASLRIKNNSASSRIISVHLCAAAAYYTGVPANDLKENSNNAQLEPHAETVVSLSLKCNEYVNNRDPDAHIVMYCKAIVKETNQRYITRETFWLDKPHLDLKSDTRVPIGKAFDVLVKFTNTLTIPLTGGHLNIEGPGMQRVPSIKIKKAIAPGEEFRETVQLKARRIGRKEVIANFYCKQIVDITGVIEVDVVEESKAS
ncbi:protein-glutamine gamma-glutamyltransferase K isoform X3 [Octopus sinensis]|uniref:Protein-glutamine gamma-glutamyltransferase K isoform X3 n=1 Tax=Octopus sinensis TaxID=2607531 RepID=A0A6P7SGQ3_9MOLL|nr:protein-glutamine gamma-glutamyltransferase K isoform X3 [Octopus sinensis]